MKKIYRKLIVIIFTILIIIGLQNAVQAKSYTIEDMDIQAIINQDGSLRIKQEITYDFKGSYNGIYINIPFNLEDKEADEIVKGNKIDDDFYNGGGVQVNNVSITNGKSEIPFSEVQYAKNGTNQVYTIEVNRDLYQIKVYSPTTDSQKTFKLDYTILDLCAKHNDVGELYYNFIGGEWDVEIKNLNIDIYLPNNQEQIYIWGHGPYNGKSTIVNNTYANFKVKNIKPGQYVAARMMFDKSNIEQSTKLSNIDAKDIIFKDEQVIAENKEEKNAFTRNIIIFAVCLLIYWIVLMVIFENDKKYMVNDIGEDELFKKYNPMIAGCIQGSRTILARDIIAVILDLINKKIIKLELRGQLKGKDNYEYIISKKPELENQMDGIEKYVYDWVFENNGLVYLADRLKEMPKEKEANKKFKELNGLVEITLAGKGANQAKVPLLVRCFNIFLFILSLVMIYKHILFNGFSIYSSEIAFDMLYVIFMYLIAFIPLLMGILYIPLNLIIMLRHKVNKTVQKVTGQKVVTTTISLIVFFGIIIILTAIFSPIKYIIADEILICIATILILTDNLMLKNNVLMIEDYSRLNTLKYKIENYSMMDDKDIEQITLWERYLSYAVSFGIADKIVKRINGLYIDDDLTNLINDDIFYDFIKSDYYVFYTYASLDRRFLREYGKATGKMLKSMGSRGSSGRRRRKFFRGWRFFWRRRKRRRPEAHFKK